MHSSRQGVCFLKSGSPPNHDTLLPSILADDLDYDYKQDRLAIMPNLRKLREAGVHLINHVAAQPVCGPSRSSLLAGRYPHNAGYIMNDGNTSIAAWTRNENNTIGTWLSDAGYYTVREASGSGGRVGGARVMTKNWEEGEQRFEARWSVLAFTSGRLELP